MAASSVFRDEVSHGVVSPDVVSPDAVFHDAVSRVASRVASHAVSCDHPYDEAFSYPLAKRFSCRERYSPD